MGQAAPAGGEPAAIAGSGARGFHGARIHLAGFPHRAKAFECQTVVVESFGIVLAAAGVQGQLAACIFEASSMTTKKLLLE